ncbi:2-oxo acid dehydrogenase subunit E2 [Emcibacter nanhaiensis]|uniref:2-oxo acid dehydrogenase subunit E2 n=1 Tax=Emcibacter nanhaiensis TaxID=1505037 RepID=A0A501PKG2_9PROT|nr:2-oxo acid dehydrogenase subunit E2 [Emcibacter nanhaiensis]TPD60206.1 2-oxo acid dehydrogenase subunit E2 [Emcibacter nanhaiensis]
MPEDRTSRLGGMRAMIADKMQESLQTSAQLSYHCECNAGVLVAARARLKEAGSSVSIEDLLIKAVSDTLTEMPMFNARIEGKELTLVGSHHISVAISLPNGLMAPTIFDVQDKSLEDICAARKGLIERARNGKLTVREMTGGSFTVSNLGLRRIHYFTPILNRPQVAILGIGQVKRKPVVLGNGDIASQPMMGLSLTTDHRIVDGDPSGQFLTKLSESIEKADLRDNAQSKVRK